jgi:hypothetical protein
VYENKWTRAQPKLAKHVQQLVADGYSRLEIATKLGIKRYTVDRLRGGTEPEGGMPMRRKHSASG